MKDKLSTEALAKRTVSDLIILPEKYQAVVIKKWYEACDEEKRIRLHYISFACAYPKRRTKIEIWMESIFTRNIKLKPKVAAIICVNHFRIQKKMLPQFISLAQKVKGRISSRESMRRKKLSERMDQPSINK